MKRLGLAAFGVLIFFAALELGCRLFVPRLNFSNLKMNNWPEPRIFQASAILPYELVPNIPRYTNSLGMRDKERGVEKPKGVSRIVFLGDSITMYARFTELLEDRLERSFPGLYQVWNCAVGGYGIREYVMQLRRSIPRYKPDLVVIAFCLNDLDPAPVMYYDEKGQLNCYMPLPGIPGVLELWLYKHSYAYRRWLEILARSHPDLGAMNSMPMGEKSLAAAEREAARIAVPLLAVVFPWLKPDSEWTLLERAQYENLTGLLKRRGIAYLDLSKAFPSDRRRGLRRTPDDHIHINSAGDRLAVDSVLGFLRAQGFVPGTSSSGAR